MRKPLPHTKVLQRWSLARRRSELAGLLSEIRGVSITHMALLMWETRNMIPEPWRDAVVEAAIRDGQRDVTRESLDLAAEAIKARKPKARKIKPTQPQPGG